MKSIPFRRFNLLTKSNINNNVQLTIKGAEKHEFAKSFYLNGKLQENISLNIKSQTENNLNFYITCAETASEQLYFNLKSSYAICKLPDGIKLFVILISVLSEEISDI